DLLYEGYEEGYLKLLEILEESNLVIYKGYSTLSEDHVNPDPTLGIGKYYAWQIPAYAIILRKLLNKS
ncbi:MAG: AAA family ATPase, partial [Crenarchaeota archaeon]|nr:AAA family ATPase [Thermoproteota archaeon]